MFFNIGGKLNSPLRLEDARFSAEDLFGILGGYDSCMLTAGTGFLSYDDEKLASSVQTWRKKTVSRMRGTGLFDDDGQEAEVLSHALLPILHPEIDISNASPGGAASAGLFVGQDGWTALKKDKGFLGGWAILPFDVNQDFSEVCSSVFDTAKVERSAFEDSGYIRDSERDTLTDAVNSGDLEALKSIAWLRNVSADALQDLSDAYGASLGKKPKAFELWTTHTEGCEFEPVGGVRTPFPSSGYRKTSQVTVIPAKGFYMKIASAPCEGDPFTFEFDDELCRARTFCQVGFVREGNLFKEAFAIPEWYPKDALSIDDEMWIPTKH